MKSTNPENEQIETFFSRELLTDPGIPYPERRDLLRDASRAYLEYHRDRIREKHRSGASGRTIVGCLTSFHDTLLRNLFRSVSADMPENDPGSCALIALGGYGRAELNPGSDIDIMFFLSGKEKQFAENVSERMLYLMWDIGLEVGYSVRNPKDCLDMADRDITARTALLDSRFLVGNESLYQEYEKTVLQWVMTKNTQAYIREKLEENSRRLQKYGSTVYLLEPNIKEGEGGLRDLQTAIWVARVKFKARSLQDLVIKGVINEREGREFEDAFDYLWKIRNELHYLSNSKNEQIHFDQQEKIAQFLGYHDNRQAPAVEQFMQEYYSHATFVEHISASLITRATKENETGNRILGYLTRRAVEEGFYVLRGELWTTDPELFAREPGLMMRAFLLAQRQSVRLSLPVKTQIRQNLDRINDRIRRSKVMADGFLEILRYRENLSQTLRDMHHLQFLNHFLPEFERIFCKVQHDAYHIYTVDVHSIFAVDEILKLWRGAYAEPKPLLTKVANDIEKRELLLLAVLFHDIGKGEGKDHCNTGAALVRTIARRLGLNREDSGRLEFLVRHHLEMAHIAQRRDLHDEKLIADFAQTMQMTETLKMLYLLTFADIKAVGPDVWTEWKARLLEELYHKAFGMLERGDFRLEGRSERIRNRKRKVVAKLAEEFGDKRVRDTLKPMGTRYLVANRSSDMIEHLRLFFSRHGETLALKVEHVEEGEYTQVTISTLDIPGLFSKITGILAANGINILGAQIYTHSDGEALDILQVRGTTGDLVRDQVKWERVKEELGAAIEGRIRVEDLFRKRQAPSFLKGPVRPQLPARVEVDNQVSTDHSVIDIYAHDRVGLLYEITKTLKELGLYIGVSKISTKVDQIADTFYVQDIFGQKVSDALKIEEIIKSLSRVLEKVDSTD